MTFDVYKSGTRDSSYSEEQITEKFSEEWKNIIFELDSGDSAVFVYEKIEWEVIRTS